MAALPVSAAALAAASAPVRVLSRRATPPVAAPLAAVPPVAAPAVSAPTREARSARVSSPGSSSSAASSSAVRAAAVQPVLGPVLDDAVTPRALDLLARGDGLLARAVADEDAGSRFVTAHLAALRVGAAVLAVRGRPTGRRPGALNAWVELARVAPELHDWAEVFSRAASVRAAVEAGRAEVVTPAAARRHVELAVGFAAQVHELLGVPAAPAALTARPAGGRDGARRVQDRHAS